MNLNLYISRSGSASRRNAALLIKEGRVSVNGNIVLEPWHKVGKGDRIEINGKLLRPEKHVYLLFNKPKGVTSTLKDRFAEKMIADYLPAGVGRVYPAGRLDRFSRGLMILTNDGELCYKITHPKFEIEKEYIVSVEGRFDGGMVPKLAKGIRDGEDVLKVKCAKVEKSDKDRSVIKVVVCEGKKRQLRRLFEYLGFSVIDLIRVRIGSLQLGSLKPGNLAVIDEKTAYSLTIRHDMSKYHRSSHK